MHCICCEVLRPEIEYILKDIECPPVIHFLEQGLHDTPDKLRSKLQGKVDELEKQHITEIILGYGLCGKGVCGLSSKKATLIIPSIHDCIPLLLGCSQQEVRILSENGSTFWMSPGWLKFSQLDFIKNRQKRQKEYEELYGPDNALFLMEQERLWLCNYTNACYIRWIALANSEKWEQEACFVAKDARLPFRIIEGKSDFLRALLLGGKDSRFLKIPPYMTIDMDSDGNIITVEV